MYLAFALLAPIAMFGLMWGLTWFEDRMLGPAVAGGEVPRSPRATPAPVPDEPMAEDTPPPVPIPLQPVTTVLAAAPTSPPADDPGRVPIRHHLRHPIKRSRRLRAA